MVATRTRKFDACRRANAMLSRGRAALSRDVFVDPRVGCLTGRARARARMGPRA
ncbi:Hypothetical protein A7982_11160 [Minicystis rosea]|nr:Hypothetical protein A7982_11160 [Minicystis rosea]